VCVCVRERERDRIASCPNVHDALCKRESVCMRERRTTSLLAPMSMTHCASMRERERERERQREREKHRKRKSEREENSKKVRLRRYLPYDALCE